MDEIVALDSTFNVTYVLQNLGTGEACDLEFSIDLEEDVKDPFTIVDVPTVEKISTGDSKTVTIKVKVNDDAYIGEYKLKHVISYKNIKGNPRPDAYGSNEVKISYGETNPEFIVNKVTLDTQQVNPGEFKVDIYFQNKGDMEAKNVTCTLDGLENFEILDISSKNI